MASDFASKAGLKARGWTDAGIVLFLGSADKTAKNPHYKKAAPMQLYSLSRVEEAERSAAFHAFQEKSLTRKAGATKAVVTKKQALLKELESWTITVDDAPLDEARKAAIDECIAHLDQTEKDGTYATLNSSPEFLERITFNHIRHQLTSCERRLEQLFGKVGTREAYTILREKIFDAIREKYPDLAEEFMRQIARYGDRQAEINSYTEGLC